MYIEKNSKVYEDDYQDFKYDAEFQKLVLKSILALKTSLLGQSKRRMHPKRPTIKVPIEANIDWEALNLLKCDLYFETEFEKAYVFNEEEGVKLLEKILHDDGNIVEMCKMTNYAMVIKNRLEKMYYLPDSDIQTIDRYIDTPDRLSRILETLCKRSLKFSFDFKSGEETLRNIIFSYSLSCLELDIARKQALIEMQFGLNFPRGNYFEIADEKRFWEEVLAAYEKTLLLKSKEIFDFDLGKEFLEKPGRTFAMPAHTIVFTLLAMFAGRPERIPRKLLEKPYGELTDKEKEEADKFLNSIIEKVDDYDVKSDVHLEKRIAVISDNPKVEARAEIGATLFSDDLVFREGALALYIKKAFGAEGLRHLLALLIGLEEGGRKGVSKWNLNDHLSRLGYKKHKGTYKTEQKITATEIVKIFTSLFITARQKKNSGFQVIEGQKLFSIDGFKQETFNKVIIDEEIVLRATGFWYLDAIEPKDNESPKFTKLLYEIAQENHRERPYTILLAPLLAVFWRINRKDRALRLDNLIDWCDIKRDRTLKQSIRKLQDEFEYMRKKGYLGDWSFEGETYQLANCENPLDITINFYPPNWLQNELELIDAKREQIISGLQKKERLAEKAELSKEDLSDMIKKSGLTYRAFAEKIGVSPSTITRLVKGDRSITSKMAKKILSNFNDITL